MIASGCGRGEGYRGYQYSQTPLCPIAAVGWWAVIGSYLNTFFPHTDAVPVADLDPLPPVSSVPFEVEMEKSRNTMQKKPVRLIAAVCNNMGIGKDGKLPWDLP